MARDVVYEMPAITVKGWNWFYQGWIEACFGLPKRKFDEFDPKFCVRDIDCECYSDGYDMCVETGDFPVSVVRSEITVGHISVEVRKDT